MTRLLKVTGILCLFVSLAAFAQESPVPVPPIAGGGGSDAPAADLPYSTLRYNSTSGTSFVGSSYFSSKLGFSYLYDSYLGDSAVVPNGSFTLVQHGNKRDTEITYAGGASIHSQQTGYDSQYQRLVVSETFHGARWRVNMTDQFSYLPNSAYGSSVDGGLSSQMIQILELLLPNQSFLQERGQQYMNAVIANADRTLSRNFSVHGEFNYSLLQYLDSGLVGLQEYQGSGGLTRQIGKQDSIAVDYTGSRTDFSGSTTMVSNKVALTYTHSFRNRATLILGIGPESVRLENPGQPDITRTLVDGSASLNWQTRKVDTSLSYSHNSGGGGGLLRGAELHTATVAATRRVARVWTPGLHGGFSNVSELSSVFSTGTPISYSSYYTGCSVSRDIGRTMLFHLNYDFQYQTENQRAVSALTYRRNSVMAGLTYNLRPISLR
jgi:hypothetical protein